MKYTLEDMYGLEGKVTVITGASRGIGKEVAIGLGQLGSKVVMIGSTEKTLREAEKEVQDMGIDAIGFVVDITDEAGMTKVAEAVYEKYGHIDNLVNNAGISHLDDQITFDIEKFRRVMDVNVTGTMIGCKVFGKYMVEQGSGRIVNISSVRSVQGKSRYSAYAASKGAVNNLTRSIAVEFADKGVNVNAVAPIFTLTDINKKALENEEMRNWVISRLPVGRMCEKHQLVGPIAFLLSPCADFIFGEILFVDGGWTAG